MVSGQAGDRAEGHWREELTERPRLQTTLVVASLFRTLARAGESTSKTREHIHQGCRNVARGDRKERQTPKERTTVRMNLKGGVVGQDGFPLQVDPQNQQTKKKIQ